MLSKINSACTVPRAQSVLVTSAQKSEYTSADLRDWQIATNSHLCAGCFWHLAPDSEPAKLPTSILKRRVMKFRVKNLAAIALCCGCASVCGAQNAPAGAAADPQAPAEQAAPAAAPAAPAAPAALPTPSITGPLSGLPPALFDAGPVGKV